MKRHKTENNTANATREKTTSVAVTPDDQKPFKPDFPGQTREQHAIGVAVRRDHDDMRRYSCNLLGFWRVCDQNRCRRAHTCSGDQHRCFRIFWPQVHPEVKVILRTAILAAGDKLSPAETEARVFAALDWHRANEDDNAAAFAAKVAQGAPATVLVPRFEKIAPLAPPARIRGM